MDRNGKKLGTYLHPATRYFLRWRNGIFRCPPNQPRLVHLRGERYAFIGCTRIVLANFLTIFPSASRYWFRVIGFKDKGARNTSPFDEISKKFFVPLQLLSLQIFLWIFLWILKCENYLSFPNSGEVNLRGELMNTAFSRLIFN